MHYDLVPIDRSHLEGVLSIEGVCFERPWSEQTFTDALYHDTVSLIVAQGEDGMVLGYAELSVILDEGCLEKIAVDPKYRRQGVAEELLGAFLRFGRANLAFITLEVRESNEAALHLYKSCGFRVEAVRKDYYRNPKENALILWKRGFLGIPT